MQPMQDGLGVEPSARVVFPAEPADGVFDMALPLEVQGLPLPRFEFDWWVVDDPAQVKRAPRRPKPRFPVDVPFEVRGNGDGVLQPEEDLDLDGIIGTGDILEALAQFGCADADFPDGCSADVDGDGVVGVSDILSVLSLFGLPC